MDQSPAALWIVNPDNVVRGNSVSSSHYGYWYRALPKPDGVTGQEQGDDGVSICPNKTPLGVFEDNVVRLSICPCPCPLPPSQPPARSRWTHSRVAHFRPPSALD